MMRSNAQKNITDREVIREIARTDGAHHKPRYYKQEAKVRYGRDCSSSSVTKSIGTYAVRLSLDDNSLVTRAKEFIAECRYDAGYAEHILHKAALS